MIFIFLIFSYVILYYVKEFLDRRKCPPGPWPVPILGTLMQISQAAKLPNIALANIAKQYGSEITRHKMGSQETVILSSYEAITTVLSHPDAMGRAMVGIFYDRSDGKRLGFISREGKSWEKKRNWTFRTLKDFGFGKSQAMENITMEMFDEFLNALEKRTVNGEGVLDVENAFTVYVFKSMWKMLVGRCTPEDDIIIKMLLDKTEKMLKSGTFGAGILSVFPFLKYVAPEWTGFNAQMDLATYTRKSARELLRDIGSKMATKKPENLTEAYTLKMAEEPEDFSVEDFEILFMDILQGSSDTTSSFLEACMLFSVLNPKVQAKVYREIEENVPKGQQPTVSDLKRMKYIQAFFLEVHRCTKVLQSFVPRRATKEFYYKNYLIKEDTQILADAHTAFNNKMFGDDFHTFRPERFISENGELTECHKYMIHFSVGKRNCPGESLAEVTYFLFFVNIVKNYESSTMPGEPLPRSDMNVGFSSRPFPFQMRVRKR